MEKYVFLYFYMIFKAIDVKKTQKIFEIRSKIIIQPNYSAFSENPNMQKLSLGFRTSIKHRKQFQNVEKFDYL